MNQHTGYDTSSSVWDACAMVPLRLAKPRAIQECLAYLGLDWTFDNAVASADGHVLYAWVDGGIGAAAPAEHGVLYLGSDVSASEAREDGEQSWAEERAEHAREMAMYRRRAAPVGGPVQFTPPALEWLDELFVGRANSASVIAKHRANIARALPPVDGPHSPADVGAAIVRCAERIAIRLTVHLGDVVAPVNSGVLSDGESAVDTAADWAAFDAVRQYLAVRARGIRAA